jgi:hypothetical protein
MEDWIHVAFAVQLFQGSQTFDVWFLELGLLEKITKR